MNRIRLSLPILAVILAAAVAVIVSIDWWQYEGPPAIAAGSAISLKQSSVGEVLVDANGRTLYLFGGDKPNVSAVSSRWPRRLATIHLDHPAPRDGRRDRRPDRHCYRHPWIDTDHVQRPPALLLSKRPQAGSSARPGVEPVRRPLVRALSRRCGDHVGSEVGARARTGGLRLSLQLLSARSPLPGVGSLFGVAEMFTMDLFLAPFALGAAIAPF